MKEAAGDSRKHTKGEIWKWKHTQAYRKADESPLCLLPKPERISEHTTTTWIPRCMCTISGQNIDSGLFLFEHHANQVRDYGEDSKIGQSLGRHQISYTTWRRQSKHRAQFGLFAISNNSAPSTPFIAQHNRTSHHSHIPFIFVSLK